MSELKPLRHTLKAAINMRTAAMRNNRSRRKDDAQIRVAMGRAQQFLTSYPFATDARVLEYARVWSMDVMRIVPGNQVGMFRELMGLPNEEEETQAERT
jgi:hypothetical protein